MLLSQGDEYGFLIDDEDILTGYRTPRLQESKDIDDDQDDLSDYIKARLFLARTLAMIKYYHMQEQKERT